MISPRITSNASNAIQNVSPSRWNDLINTWGGYSPNQTGNPDIGTAMWSIFMQYPDICGPVAYVILFSVPFVMLWVVHADLVPVSIVGIFFGFYVSFFVGGAFFMVGLLFIALALTTVIWSLAQKRG
jgi:hypothetical protein